MSKQNKAGNKGVSKINARNESKAAVDPLPRKRTPTQTDTEVDSLTNDLDADEGDEAEESSEDEVETFDHSDKAPEDMAKDEGGKGGKPAGALGPKGGSTYVGSYQQKMRQLGPVMARATLTKRIAERVIKLGQSFAGWSCEVAGVDVLSEARGKLSAAHTLIVQAAKELETVPREWRPAPGTTSSSSSGGKELAVGDKVSIREKIRSKYTGMLEAKDMTGLVVKAAAHGKVKVTTKEGVILMLPRGHVAPEAPEAEAPAKAAAAE